MKTAAFSLLLLLSLVSGCTKKTVAGIVASSTTKAGGGTGSGSGESYDGDGILRDLLEGRRQSLISALTTLQSGIGVSQLGDEKNCVADADTCARLSAIAADSARKTYVTALLLSSAAALIETARVITIIVDYTGHPTADGDSDGWATPGAGNPIRVYGGIAPTRMIATELHEMAHVTIIAGAYHSDGDILGPNLSAQNVFNDLGALMTAFIATQSAPEGVVDKTYAATLQNGAYLGGRHASFARGLATTSDGGTIVVGGRVNLTNNNWSWGLAKFDATGALDTKFWNGGLFPFPTATYSEARDVTIDASNRIVVSGNLCLPGRVCAMAIMRFSSDGSLDTTFGNGMGYLTAGPANSGAFRHKVLSDGKILVSGPVYTGASYSDIATVRVLPNGEGLDMTFGTSGIVNDTNPGAAVYNTDLTLLPDGSFAVAGLATKSDVSRLVVVKYGGTGTLIGKKLLNVGSKGDAVARPGGSLASDSDGNIFTVASDWVGDHFAATLFVISPSDVVSKVTLASKANQIPYSLVLDARRRPIVAIQESAAAGGSFVVQRLGHDGSLDATFAMGSRATLTQASLIPVFPKILTTADGRLLVAGTAEQAQFHDIFLYRLSGHL